MKKQTLYLSLMCFCCVSVLLGFVSGQGCSTENADKAFRERIQPVSGNSGFRMEGYWVWGGSVVKVDGIFHLFASRWPKDSEFPSDYRTKSEIVRATSTAFTGPYTLQEIVIGERDSTYWDSNMAHNPTIHKVGDAYALFYIGSDFTTYQDDSHHLLRRIGYASSHEITGPWERSEKPLIDCESNNPAVLVEEDGSVKMMFRDAPLRVYVATAPSYEGPYEIVNDNVWPEGRLEDFYLFRRDGVYHVLCEDNVGAVTGHERWGAHLVSENGITGWKNYDPVIAYDHELRFNDGSVMHCVRRERPQLFIEDNAVTGLITSVYDGEYSWCQPVEIIPAY